MDRGICKKKNNQNKKSAKTLKIRTPERKAHTITQMLTLQKQSDSGLHCSHIPIPARPENSSASSRETYLQGKTVSNQPLHILNI